MDSQVTTLRADQERFFAESLRVNVDEVCQDASETSPVEAFVAYAADAVFEGGNAPEMIPIKIDTRIGNDHIRLYGYGEIDDDGWLCLFTGKYSADAANIQNDELQSIARQALNAFKHVDQIARAEKNRAVQDFCSHVTENFSSINGVRLVICYNGRIPNQAIPVKHATFEVSVEIFDVSRLFRLAGPTESKSDIVVNFVAEQCGPLKCLEASTKTETYRTFLFLMDGMTIHRLMKRYSQRLFDLNLRTYLRGTPVNKEVIKTIKEQPENFLAFNNGICATAEDIEVVDGKILKIVGLQIVNGAQTSSAIHRAAMLRGADKVDVSSIQVSVKLTIVKAGKLGDFVPKITKYANSHNKIDYSDLSSNNTFNTEFALRSNEIWCPGEKKRWFYERARGMYEAKIEEFGPSKEKEARAIMPKGQKLTKLDLAKYLGAWDLKPYIVANGRQYAYRQLMADYMPRINDGTLVVDHLFYKRAIAKAIIFKASQKLMKNFENGDYGHAVYPYSVALLAMSETVDLDAVWRDQALNEGSSELLFKYMRIVRDELIRNASQGKNATQWAKKEQSWSVIRRLAGFEADGGGSVIEMADGSVAEEGTATFRRTVFERGVVPAA